MMLTERHTIISSVFHHHRVVLFVLLVVTTLLLIFSKGGNAQQIGGAESNTSLGHRIISGISEGLRLTTKSFAQLYTTGQQRRPTTKVKIACVGFGRTGTTSFVQALKMLNYIPVHDDERFEISDLMEDMFIIEETSDDDDTSFTPPTTTTYPISNKMEHFVDQVGERGFDVLFWYSHEFVEWAARAVQDNKNSKYKDLKIILTVRDDPQKWAESWATVSYAIDLFHAAPMRWSTSMKQMLPCMDHLLKNVTTAGQPDLYKNITALAEGYEYHIKHVQEMVLPEKLLVFNVKQGWEPLCNFLNLPIPSAEFPHINDRVVIRTILGTIWVLTWVWPLIPFGIIYLLVVLFQRCSGNKKSNNNKTKDE